MTCAARHALALSLYTADLLVACPACAALRSQTCAPLVEPPPLDPDLAPVPADAPAAVRQVFGDMLAMGFQAGVLKLDGGS